MNVELSSPKKPWWQSSTAKFFVVGFLILIMCIPLALVSALVWERKNRYEEVQKDISQHWGQAQGLVGPVLFIPFNPGPKTPQQYAVLLPDKLNITGSVRPEIRHRGIFQSVVYTSDLVLQATFAPITTLTDAEGVMQNPKWTQATIGLSLNDAKGLLSGTQVQVNGNTLNTLQPAAGFSGIQTPLDVSALTHGKPLNITLTVRLNGSRVLGFSPAGKQSQVTLTGTHNKPSFTGEYLPADRQLTSTGFKAVWDVSHLARRFPQLWRQTAVTIPALNVNPMVNTDQPSYPIGDGADIISRLRESAFGVTLMQPVDAYKQTERSLKYGILFLALTFLTYFLFERLTRSNIHLLQYSMVGLALSLFYLIVLSVSELIGFPVAYALGTIATVGLISYYSAGFIPRKQQFVMPIVLTGIYAYLYSLLQMEDYSLLFGTLGLFVILAVLMMVTRKIHTQPE